MSQEPLSILISGSGVAGATLALTLARQPGFKLKPNITLIERSPVPRTTGQAVDIREAGVDVIRKLGLEPDIKARHTTETGLSVLNPKGNTVAHLAATGDEKAQSATSEYEILRGELAALLLDGVDDAKSKGAEVNVVYGESIQTLEEREDGVDICFSNGKLQDQRFDVVIAADGISSNTRSLIFGKDDKREHVQPSGAYLAFFSIPRVPEDDNIWKWCILPPGLAMHLRPHRNGKTMGVYLCICNPKKERSPELDSVVKADLATQKKYLRQRFQHGAWQTQRFLEGLDAADDFYMTHWCQVRTPKWAKGRCVTLGDAAFATMGIGTSLAMTGAYCIAGELSKIHSSKEVPQALETYESTFRPYTDKFNMSMPGLPQLINPQTAWGNWILTSFLKIVFLLKIPDLLRWAASRQQKQAWKLPEYGW